MGIAIILKDIDFKNSNLGNINLQGNVPVAEIYIDGPDIVVGERQQFNANFKPLNTTQRMVLWSIQSGNSYAAINSLGVLTVLSGANNNSVKIRATSSVDNTIYAEKDIIVTYASDDAIDFETQTWLQGERMPDGSINQGGPPHAWGYCATAFDVDGISALNPIVPAIYADYIIEALYYDENDTYVGVKYLCAKGYWAQFGVTIDTAVPTGAKKVYFNIAGSNVAFNSDIAIGVSLIKVN